MKNIQIFYNTIKQMIFPLIEICVLGRYAKSANYLIVTNSISIYLSILNDSTILKSKSSPIQNMSELQ